MAEEIYFITKSWMSDVSCDVYNFLNFSAVRHFFARKSAVVLPNKSADIYKLYTRIAEGDEGNTL